MKLVVVAFALVLSLSSFLRITDSPTFEVIGEHVRTDTIQSSKRLDIAQFEIKNSSNKPIHLSIKNLTNTFPSDWDYSMCAYGECQIGIPELVVLKTIEPGEKGFVAIHVIPKRKKGEGKVEFEVFNAESGQKEQLIFHVISL